MATHYNPRIITDGLIVYLDAGNPRSYPGTGTTWTNLTGNPAYNGTLVGGPTFSSANKGVIVLDGVDDWIQVPVNMVAVDYTIIGAARYVSIGGRTFSAKNNNWLMGHWAGYTEEHYAEGWVYQPNTISDTNWRMYAATRKHSTDEERFYVNGVVKTNTGGGWQGPNEMAIGSVGGYGEFSNSAIGCFMVYDRVLTDAEIASIYNTIGGRYIQ